MQLETLLTSYGTRKMGFKGYYKCSFHFGSTTEGHRLEVSAGGRARLYLHGQCQPNYDSGGDRTGTDHQAGLD